MTATSDQPLDFWKVAQPIGHGHAFKHVSRGEFTDRGLGLPVAIDGKPAFSAHIYDVMTDTRTRVFRGVKGKVYFYNFPTNTAVAYDPANKDLGSCWRAKAGLEEVRRLVEQDFDKRLKIMPPDAALPNRARVFASGIERLPVADGALPISSFATATIRSADPEAPKANRFFVPRHRQV